MFGTSLREGDWVRTDKVLPVSLSDHLSGDGLRRGTRGVVTGVSGSRVTVDFDTGWGLRTETVRASALTRVRRDGGTEQFRRSASRSTIIRVGLALALFGPLLYFVGWYWWTFGTFNGLLPTLIDGIVDDAIDTLNAALAHPVQAVLYSVILTLVTRWVFRR